MKKLITLLIEATFLFQSCGNGTEKKATETQLTTNVAEIDSVGIYTRLENKSTFQSKNPEDFIPEGYILYKEEGQEILIGDLNKDGLEDRVLIIKKTGKDGYDKNQFDKIVDKNRRGIIILFNKGNYFELALKNYDCFSSENEDGGVYFPPELWVEIKKGNLHINYAHGRYGGWGYTFRHQNRDFELIGYDEMYNRGPVPQEETSINFLTRKKLTRDNLNKDVYGDDYEDDNFVDTWTSIYIKNFVRLSEIKDFDNIDVDKLYTVG